MNRFFARLFGKPSSKDVAKERLQLVLLGDRGISAELLTAMKEDIIEVLSKYVEIESDELAIQLTQVKKEEQTAACPALLASIPVRRIKERQSA